GQAGGPSVAQGAPAQAYSTSAAPGGGHAPGHGGGPQAALDVDAALARYPSFDHVVELIRANRDVRLLVEVESGIRLAAYRPGRIEFTPAEGAAQDLAQRLGSALQRWTGNRWAVTLVNGCEAETIAEIRDAAEIARRNEAAEHPLVRAALAAFPKAKITGIRSREEEAAQVQAEALPEVEDEWDPFEEE
ncbi:DNA polymerase III subunit gamma/tau, partial [Aquicoccus sp. SCR17]|nr:DNA polymerase III subunit gamma/tau [Carideicomes alvinocaridis]